VGETTRRLEEARDAAAAWTVSKPRTARRNQAAARAIEGYVRVDSLLVQGAALPESWAARSVALPSVDEVAEALAAVGLMMPIESASVKTIAGKVVEVMVSRRAPRRPVDLGPVV
jgi:hypothetical protein